MEVELQIWNAIRNSSFKCWFEMQVELKVETHIEMLLRNAGLKCKLKYKYEMQF